MQEKFQNLIEQAITHKNVVFPVALGLLVLGGSVYAMSAPKSDSLAAVATTPGSPAIAIAVAGRASTWGAVEPGNSWPGELISLGNVPVQPSREGMITSWRVHVGQRVAAGEVLGTLSAPPQMPDTLAMLADEEKMAAMARTNAVAKRAYAAERLPQLEALRANTERSLAASNSILGTDGVSASSLPMIEAKKAAVRAILRGSLVRAYPLMSGQGTLPARLTAITLKDAIGAQDSRSREKFQPVLSAALAGVDKGVDVPVAQGLAYFDLAIKLADASIPDGGTLTESELAMLKDSLHEDQEAFIMAADKLRETELMAVDTQKEAFEQLRMIDNDIAMLKQDLAMADGDVAAKEASSRAVRGAVAGGTAIVAPKSGAVSAIMKKTGEYVMPGTPVAIVTGSEGDELIVRFRVPVNVRKPAVGETLSVVRSGFPDAPRQAKLIGIGSALDDGGAIMADAVLADAVEPPPHPSLTGTVHSLGLLKTKALNESRIAGPTPQSSPSQGREGSDWPVGAAVRVLAPSENDAITIKLSSLWFDANGAPNLWAVSDAGRVYAKPVTLGRTLGESVEVVGGLLRGERYVEKPTPEIAENMLVGDIIAAGSDANASDAPATADPHAGHSSMPGMEM